LLMITRTIISFKYSVYINYKLKIK